MAKLNISEAARFSGKSRTTLHKRIKNGSLSSHDGKIDTSELIRVFGEASKPAPAKEDELNKVNIELAVMKAQLESLKNESALKNEIIDGLRQQVRILEHRPAPTPQNPIQEATAPPTAPQGSPKGGRLAKLGRFIFDT